MSSKSGWNNGFKHSTMWTCLDVCESLSFLLDNIYVRFGDAVYRQVIGIPMGTNCAPLVADLFLYCYVREFMLKACYLSTLIIFGCFMFMLGSLKRMKEMFTSINELL